MRVIGGHDYYDSAAAYGIDTTIVFVRNSEILTVGDMRELNRFSSGYITLCGEHGSVGDSYYHSSSDYGTIDGKTYHITYPKVLFCGKFYKGIIIRVTQTYPSYIDETHYFWKPEKLIKWLEENNLHLGNKQFYWHEGQRMRHDLDNLFEPRQATEDTMRILIDRKLTIARQVEPASGARKADDDSGWRANCDGLKDLGFQKAVDPTSAFQAIEQWVTGTLSANNGPATVSITDNSVKIAKHGFDKWSFRKHKDDAK